MQADAATSVPARASSRLPIGTASDDSVQATEFEFDEGGTRIASGIAKLWKPVINVTDLDSGEAFWSALLGLSPQGRHGQFSVLDAEGRVRTRWMDLAPARACRQVSVNAGTHLDFRVDDVPSAIEQIEAIGGVLTRPAGLYAPDGEALLEWAVLRDPFGNEFWIIRRPLDSSTSG